MGRQQSDEMANRPAIDEREDCARSAPVLGGLEPWQERQLRTRIIAVLHWAGSLSSSAIAGKILEALQQPLEPK